MATTHSSETHRLYDPRRHLVMGMNQPSDELLAIHRSAGRYLDDLYIYMHVYIITSEMYHKYHVLLCSFMVSIYPLVVEHSPA